MPAPLFADVGAPPYAMEKHYSADITVVTSSGMTVQSKTYVDGDKMRGDVVLNGMQMSVIVRKDKQKVYEVLDAQKMVMETTYDPNSSMGHTAGSFGPEGTFKLIGPDTVDGVVCTKYTVTSDKTKQVFHFWLDPVRKIPVQMAAVDGSLTVKWKNFAAGPQDPALFEPPAGYQVTSLSGIPGAGQ